MYDYVGSKEDWLGAGLPVAGTAGRHPRLGALAQRDVCTCALSDTVREVRDALGDGDVCLVVNDARVVLGLVRAESLGQGDDGRVEQVMEEFPKTFRPHLSPDDVVGQLERHRDPWLIVTNLDGSLVGVVTSNQVRRAAEG